MSYRNGAVRKINKNDREQDLLIHDHKILLQTRLCDFVSAKVESRRTGKESEFYRLVFSDWVNIMALTDNQEVILIRQFRFGTEKVELEIPGGAVEKGESPLEAGLRELREETGFAGKNGRIIGKVCPNPAIQNNWCYTVLVENVKRVANQHLDEMEDIEVFSQPLSDIDALIQSGQITHGLVLNALMLYSKFR